MIRLPSPLLSIALPSRALAVSRRALPLLTAGALLSATLGCSTVPAGFGPDLATARTNADHLFGSFTGRFTNVYRTPRYALAREKLGRYALTPSAIYNDTSIWTAIGPDGVRTLFGDASITNNRYVFTNVPASTPLTKLGDGRHIMRLRKLSGNEYEWFTGVDFAAGTLTANDAATVINRWLVSAEGRSGAALLADSHTAFPRTTQALGKLFTIDPIISVRDAEGGNTIYLRIRLTPDGIRPTLPQYAAYLDKYVKRIKLRFTLLESNGRRWFDAAARDGYITVRLRSHDGHFAPLEGAPVPIPDTLVLRMDATAKVGLFTVGVSKLTGEWVNVHSERERGWAMRFTKEPDWNLPPTMGMLLRSPLRRPFEGDGTRFRLGIRDTPGEQTILARRGTTTVQESAILRFFGKLGGTLMGDFVATAEDEENRFNASVFSALQEDVEALLR